MFISADMPAWHFIGVITNLRWVDRLRAGLAGRGSCLSRPAPPPAEWIYDYTVHLMGFCSASHWLAAFIPRFEMRSSRNLRAPWSVLGRYKQRLFIS
jgi:hypothetical protein